MLDLGEEEEEDDKGEAIGESLSWKEYENAGKGTEEKWQLYNGRFRGVGWYTWQVYSCSSSIMRF